MDTIVELALAARTMADVDRLEQELIGRGYSRERMLGDIEANYSSLANSADPRVLVPERITNCEDAILEFALETSATQVDTLVSPQHAARVLLSVPACGVGQLTRTDRDRLGGLIEVALLDSDDSRSKPTLWVRDLGIGVTRHETPHTILSLHGSNKLRKPWLHGVYGQGGSLTLAHCDAAVYVSRKQPGLLGPDQQDLVTVAVVRAVDRPDTRLPYYRYLVPVAGDAEALPYACQASECDFKPGTLVIHVNYDMRRMGESRWNQEGSVYAYLETLLYRPAMPYTLRDGRSSRFNQRPEGRGHGVLAGLGARIDNARQKTTPDPAITKSKGPSTLNLPGIGSIAVTWSLFADKDRRRSYVATGYTAVFTHQGQVHHSWNKARFTDRVKHRRVAERIFVEIDTSGISAKLCTRIFSSFRDQLRAVTEAEALEEAIAKWLNADPDLIEVEAELTREALKSVGQKVSQSLLDRLNRAIEVKVPGTWLVAGGGPGPGTKPPKPKKAEELGAEPTYLDMPASISLLPGGTATLHAGMNAVDGFVPEKATPELVPSHEGIALSYGYLSAGRLQLLLTASPTVSLGKRGCSVEVSFVAKAGGLKTLRHPLTINVVAEMPAPTPQEPTKNGSKPEPRPGKMPYALIWSSTAVESGSDWTDETAGELQHLTGSALAAADPVYEVFKDVTTPIPTIVLNDSYTQWVAYSRTISASDATIVMRKSNYAISLGVTIAELYSRERKLDELRSAWERAGKIGDEPLAPMTPDQRRRAVSMAARGMVAMLPGFDAVATAVA